MNRIIRKVLFITWSLIALLSFCSLAKSETPIYLKDLKQMSANIRDVALNETKILSMGFQKKFNGTYISNVMLTAKKPKHWILTHVYLTFSTADKPSWDRIVNELKKEGKPKKFDTGTSAIGYRYSINKYNVEVYKPLNGVNLSLNNLYQVILIPKKK